MYSQFTRKGFRTKGKYGNQTKNYNGRNYDSIREANLAEELDWRVKAGEIKEVIPQYKISLDVNGKHIANYYVDFKCIMADDSVQFIEYKGMELETWRLKWKLLEALLDEIEPGASMIVVKH